jgi:hypothetical protein
MAPFADFCWPDQRDRRHSYTAIERFAEQIVQTAVWNMPCVPFSGLFRSFPAICHAERVMDIRLVSSLTPEDEARLAPALLAGLTNLLDQLPICYTVRLETAGGKTFSHDHSPVEVALGDAATDIPADALLSFRVPKA